MGTVYKRGTVWWCKYYRAGKPFFETSGSKKESDAKRLLKLREGEIVRGIPVTPKVNRVTLGELYEDILNDYRLNHRKTIDEMKRRFEKHILPYFGERRKSASVTTSNIRNYVVKRLAEGAKNGGVNRELNMLKRAYSLAVENDPPKILRKPKIMMLTEGNVRTCFLSPINFGVSSSTFRSISRTWSGSFMSLVGETVRREVWDGDG